MDRREGTRCIRRVACKGKLQLRNANLSSKGQEYYLRSGVLKERAMSAAEFIDLKLTEVLVSH